MVVVGKMLDPSRHGCGGKIWIKAERFLEQVDGALAVPGQNVGKRLQVRGRTLSGCLIA